MKSECGYSVGGALPPNALTYVTRRADSSLFEAAVSGNFCYVLNSRQMGKSSLRIRTLQKLRSQGVTCCVVDFLQVCSQDIQEDQWYAAIAHHLVRSLDFHRQFNFKNYWRTVRQRRTPAQTLFHFLLYVLLPKTAGNVVIFIDEIDSVLGLKFRVDHFFALIRQCYELRPKYPALDRLSWVLLGVAQPKELIRRPQLNPFILGQPIQLQGFRIDECDVLLEGLRQQAVPPIPQPEKVLEAILYWTGGQPFLTQKLCALAVKLTQSIAPGQEANVVRQLVQDHILKNWETQDSPEHLTPMRDRLLKSQRRLSLLRLYAQVLLYDEIPINQQSDLQSELCLSGLVVQQRMGNRFACPVLQVCNQIYRHVFDEEWLIAQGIDLRSIANPNPPNLPDHIEDDAQTLYHHLLDCVRQDTPIQVIERIRTLFISCVGYRDRDVEFALRRIVSSCKTVEQFHRILNRCCYIIVNHWSQEPSTRRMNQYFLQLFQEHSPAGWGGADVTSKLQHFVYLFTQSQAYQQLIQRFTPRVWENAETDNIPISHRAYRYPFVYTSLLGKEDLHPDYAEELHRRAIEQKWRLQRDLRRYAIALGQLQRQIPHDLVRHLDRIDLNPTLLGKEELYWVFRCLAGHAQANHPHRQVARQLMIHIRSSLYRDFKRALFDYLMSSVESQKYLSPHHLDYVQRKFNQRLSKYLESIYAERDSQVVDELLLRRTCTGLIDFLIETPDQDEKGHLQFVEFISNCNPLLLTEIVMKVMLLSSHTKPNFEKRLAKVFRHYDSPLVKSSDWLIPFFENVNVGLMLNFTGMDVADYDVRL